MPFVRPALALVTGLAAALLLSGCSSTTTATDSDEASPLTAYLSAMYGGDLDDEQQQARFDEENKKRQALIAACMTEQGFTYTPDTQNSTFTSSAGEEWKPDDREWVAQYGYGIGTSPGGQEPAPQTEYVDPNAEYVASLSESEQAAYSEALYGAMSDPSEQPEDGVFEYDWTKAGCNGEADHEVTGEDPLQSEEFTPLMDALNAFWADSAAWPGMAEANAEWASCMEGAGYPGLKAQTDASQSVSEAYSKAWGQIDQSSTTGLDEATTAALSKTEIETALADLECREKTDFTARSKKAQWAAEEAFIDAHKSDLDAAKAAAAQARS